MTSLRRILFQIHMWVGLVLGVLFVALGLSGSILVYRAEIDGISSPTPRATASGPSKPLDDLIAAARVSAPDAKGNVMLALPAKAGDPATIRFLPQQREGGGERSGKRAGGERREPPRAPTIFIDPVSGQILGTRAAAMSPLVQFAHDLHGNLFMGRDGRPLVGWLGVGMLLLGLTGLVLWWPKPHQWKYAFLIRRTAKGLRFHRELHAFAGIWGFIVFIMVSFTGVAIAFPDTVRVLVGGGAPAAFNLRTGPEVTPVEGTDRIGADQAVALALKALPNSDVRSVMLPARPTQAISVALSSRVQKSPLLALVYIDPFRGQVMAIRDPATLPAADNFMSWQRPVHGADSALGSVWRFLVFLSGLLPLFFVVTGVTMWLKKRRAHVSMTAPLADGAAL